MRLASALLMLGLCAGLVSAAPDGQDEKPWSYPEGTFGDRETYPEQEPNDTCTAPQQFRCGDVIEPGELVEFDRDWYTFEAVAGEELTIGTDEVPGLATVDTYLELYADDCSTQLAFNDDGGPGLYSLISGYIAPYTGTYNILVRGFSDTSVGYYRMFLTCEEVMQDPCDTCELAEENGCMIERCTVGTIEGTTADAYNDYNQGDNPNGSCTGYTSNGLDVVLYVDLEAGDVVHLEYNNLDWDSSFYILTDCNDPASCVVGADDTVWPDPEIIDWVCDATGRYYIILDAWSSGQGGPFYLDYSIECAQGEGACCFEDGTCEVLTEDRCYAAGGTLWIPDEVCDPNPCPPVATESSTWGSIKANYR